MKINKFTAIISVISIGLVVYGISYMLSEKFIMTDQEYHEKYGVTKNGDILHLKPERIVPQLLQATDLFWQYESNKISFDRQHDRKELEFEGEVLEISNDNGLSTVSIVVDESNPFRYIECINSSEGVDKWADEVALISKGQTIKIRGKYIGSYSASNRMFFNQSHIINE